jgi:two-component system NarL family sensor kinase
VARFVGWFVAIGIVVLLLAGAATALAGHAAGEREAIIDLHAKTLGLAQLRIQPAVTDPLLDGNITAVGTVGTAVRHYVLNPASVARVKIWNQDGTIVYSDEARLIGMHQPLDAAQRAALRSSAVRSRIADPAAPENRFERSEGKLLEVDLRIKAPNGEPLVLQVFYRYGAVTTAGTHVWNRFAPFALGALASLAFVLLVAGCVLARRLRRRSRASVEPPAEPRMEPVVDEATVPPEIATEPDPDPRTQLVGALSLLIARSNGGGAGSTLDTARVHDTIPPDISELLFRATQETLRNHDHNTPVTVRVSDRDNVASLDVIEHGGNGHVDLRALTDLVADAGGHLLVDAADDGGTRVHVEVPLQ